MASETATRVKYSVDKLDDQHRLVKMTECLAAQLFGVGWVRGDPRRREVSVDEAVQLIDELPVTNSIVTVRQKSGYGNDTGYALYRGKEYTWVLLQNHKTWMISCLKTTTYNAHYAPTGLRRTSRRLLQHVAAHNDLTRAVEILSRV